MKKLIAFILAIVLVMSLVACASADATQECEPEERFRTVEADVEGPWRLADIIVDTQTGVMYLFSRGSRYQSCAFALLNADGTPMIWEGYNK